MKFIKQTKFISSVTLSLIVLLAGFAYPADSFRDFNVEVAKPFTDSLSSYRLTFSLSSETYGRLNDGRLSFQFPESFGLNSVEEVEIQSDHPSRQYRVDRISIDDGNRLVLRLERVGNDGDGGREGEHRVNVEIGILGVRNSAEAGDYRLRGRAYDEDGRIAGPSWSEFFTMEDFSSQPMVELQIISTELVAPNSPKVNINQSFTIEVLVANVGSVNAHNVVVGLSSDGASTVNTPKTIESIEPNDTAAVSFEVTAAAESGTENFTSDITSGNVSEVESVDDTAGAIIQTPAFLQLINSVPDEDTLFVKSMQEYNFTINVTNLGESSVSIGRIRIDQGQNKLTPNFSLIARRFAPVVDSIYFHEIEVTEFPLDSNTLNPVSTSDTLIRFYVAVDAIESEDFESSFIVENNPFNPNNGPVRFVYNLDTDSEVVFRIFTVTGEEVYSRRYTSGVEGGKAGTNQIQWEGRNDAGEMVLNGIYVTTIEVAATGEKASLKLAVLK